MDRETEGAMEVKEGWREGGEGKDGGIDRQTDESYTRKSIEGNTK